MQRPRLCTVNGTFHVEWYDTERGRCRRSLGTTVREIAEAAFIEFKRAAASAAPDGPLTVGSIYQAYIEDRVSAGKAAAPRIVDAWKRLAPAFARLAPFEVSEEVCRDYMRRRRAEGASDGTVHVELGYLRAALRFACRKRRWISDEPFVPMPRKPEPKDHYLTKDEARRLIGACHAPHIRLAVILMLSTAGRVGAILGLTWSRVDFDRRRILLRDPDRPVTTKGRAITPMNDMALRALEEARRAALSPFVIEYGGKQVASVKKGVRFAARRAGVSCSPHVLRHTAAVWMAEDGVPMEDIAQFLGHSNVEITRRVYARHSPEYLRRAARSLEL